jgi:hypothetical protein
MIKAIRNGITQEFSELAWSLLPPHKYDWVQVAEMPAETRDALKQKSKQEKE